MIKNKAILLNANKINRTLIRLAHEIVEKNSNLEELAIIGIRTRGDFIANRIALIIKEITKTEINKGTIDVTFYRDDFKTNLGSPKVGPSNILFNINSKNIILIDDVLYTGRTIRAAMEELFSMGRPNKVQLAVLIDRGHRELPIKADYVGKNYPTSFNEHIHVYLTEFDDKESVELVEYSNE
jgi:pyrimidine operon attenuation protein/uracil phosphoribosyltransferase|tara:strand:- start:70 stop:618 length:549 start_codon:yes stop_codon:yes gene_type:complete